MAALKDAHLHLLCKQWWQLHLRWCWHSDSTGQADLSYGPHARKNQGHVFWTLEAASTARSVWSTRRPKPAGIQQPGHWWHQPGHSVACCFWQACSPAERWCRLGGNQVLLPLQMTDGFSFKAQKAIQVSQHTGFSFPRGPSTSQAMQM